MLNTDMLITYGILVDNVNDDLFTLCKLLTDLSLWGILQASKSYGWNE